MSDHWEYFPCEMGEHTAFVFYDHGIRSKISDLDLPVLARIIAPLRNPRDDGLPREQEYDALARLEDHLIAEMRRMDGAYVGRVSIDGARHFYSYVNAGSVRIETMAKRLAAKTGYPVAVDVSDDPDKNAYWNTLYPTKRDWLLIQDLRLIEELEGRGDRLERARAIDHHARFDSGRAAKKFRAWLESEGFQVKGRIRREQDKRHGVSFTHVCRPILGDVTRYTFDLFRKAEELGGRYDGWQTDPAGAPEDRGKPKARA